MREGSRRPLPFMLKGYTMIYTIPFLTDFHDTDMYARMRPSALLRYMQETAFRQLNEYGPTMNEIRGGGHAFLLSRIRLSIEHDLPDYTPIRAETWVSNADRGFAFGRYYRILAGDTVVARASSVWALVDIESRRPMRTTEFDYHFDGEPPMDLELPRRIRFAGEPEVVGTRTVAYSDCDYNGHMNNTHYPDLLCDFLPAGESRPVQDLVINFLGEAPLGETLTVYRQADAERDGRYLFRTRRADGGSNIEAVLTLGARV